MKTSPDRPNRPNRINQPRVVNQPYQPQPYTQTNQPVRPPQAEQEEQAERGILSKSPWVLLPMRLFLGITFLYAGVQKLGDPQYFNPAAAGYIGKQISGFAANSPLHGFLIAVAAPHAALFGGLVAYGEIAIGLGTLFGFLLRPAAFFGILVNLIFFLSATWRVYPYFYGSDIVFIICWLTLLIAGPANTGLPSLDTWLVKRLSEQRQQQSASALAFFLGVNVSPPAPVTASQGQRPVGGKRQTQRYAQMQRAQQQSRRSFIWGAVIGGSSIAVIIWLWNTLHADIASTTAGTGASTTASGTTTTGSGSSAVIAQISQVPNNSSTQFTITSSGDPGVLVHLDNGQFVAYDAVCTHAGCPVSYDSSSKLLLCPCHGAAFDPAKSAAVVQGPAPTPLTSVSIKIDNKAGTISQE